jgi:type II secretory pathway pseudopilin PulG
MITSPLVGRAAGERGYLMVALLVAMSIMAIMMSAALPVWHTMARREKEAELVFRGEQYARAIGLWQQKFANQPAPSIDVLVQQRLLRKKYKDPITNDDFQVLGAGGAAPGQTQQGATPPGGGFQLTSGRSGAASAGRGTSPAAPAGRGPAPTAGFQLSGQTVAGGIVGVTSKSEEKSLRLYNGRDTYNQWVFMPVARGRAGAGARGGAPGPEGRGGGGGDGRGLQPATGGRGLPQGAGPRGGAPVNAPRGRF